MESEHTVGSSLSSDNHILSVREKTQETAQLLFYDQPCSACSSYFHLAVTAPGTSMDDNATGHGYDSAFSSNIENVQARHPNHT